MITVYELIKELSQFESNTKVSLPSDSDYIGNRTSNVSIIVQVKNKIYSFQDNKFKLVSDSASWSEHKAGG